MSGREQQGPCVHDLDIVFAQPSDQSSRDQFKTLGAGCTSGAGGTGCAYPPAIYIATANRFKLYGLRIEGAWDGIVNAPNNSTGGYFLDTIEIGALNVGLSTNGSLDTNHYSHLHFWPFGLNDGDLYRHVYMDGNTYAAKIDDGGQFFDITVVNARFALTSNFTWGTITDLQLDGDNSTLEVAANTSPGLQLEGVYATGMASNGDAHCQIDIAVKNFETTITNLNAVPQGSGNPGTALCVAGGTVVLQGGWISPQNPSSRAALVTGGNLRVDGVSFGPNVGAGRWIVPLVSVTGGSIAFQNNTFPISVGDVGGLVTVDNPYNIVAGNNFNGWGFTPPGEKGIYGISCNGPPSPHFASRNGVVTHC
ncbi:MAG: hypothetical protein JO038_09475 [Alphaproteobacteria bacterium]|nr:hypothetical protein [Alphaproteobacteria bacterium]